MVTALGGTGFTVSTRAAEQASADLRAAGAQAAGALGDVADQPNRVLLLLSDALAGDQQEVVTSEWWSRGSSTAIAC